MKNLLLIILTIATGCAMAFDGKVKMKYYSAAIPAASMSATWYISGERLKLKLDFSSKEGQTETFFIPQKEKAILLSYTIAAKDKVYYEIPAASIEPQKDMAAKRLTVKATGEKKKINGITCEKITAKSDNAVLEMWVAPWDIKAYAYQAYFRSNLEFQALSEIEMSGFPLESVTKDLSGKIISSFSLESLAEGALNASEFSAPEGYSKAATK
jgi:hypothetical protein